MINRSSDATASDHAISEASTTDGASEPSSLIRLGRDSDGPALIALIWSCWSLYPGIKMDVDLEMPQLHALGTYYSDLGGMLWVAECDARLVGMIAVHPLDALNWEICQVYVAPTLHGSGLGHALLDQAERHAVAAGADHLALWSDTRFGRAHRFYEKHSYIRQASVRALNDISNSLEYGYVKTVRSCEVAAVSWITADMC